MQNRLFILSKRSVLVCTRGLDVNMSIGLINVKIKVIKY